MRSSLLWLVSLIFVAGCASSFQTSRFEDLLKQPLGVEQRMAVVEARDDFDAVLRFEKPIHAVPDQLGISDGGSWGYSGRGYRIYVWRQWTGVKGGEILYLYGPEVRFDKDLFPEIRMPISCTAFYDAAEIWRKLKLSLPHEDEANHTAEPASPSRGGSS